MQGTIGVRSSFRVDINGLRAWAVIAVIFYHFGVAGFEGGFVGVDIFFVISGFLMTGIVVKGLERGDFSLLGFYMARARRIMPALLGLCAVLLTLGWFVLLPPDYKTLGTHAVYSLSFLSNIEYWKEAGYFDVASHEKWLLHTWSLSVEWQFYLLLPVVLWGTWWLKPGRVGQRIIVGILLATSVCASVLVTRTDPTVAFFLLPTRAWEMLAGGLVFLLAQPEQLSKVYRRWLESVGLLFIILSVVIFSKYSSWPGWRACVPVLGATMVLSSSRTSSWTGNKVFQWIGDRSYSLYLWHWPVYVGLFYSELSDNKTAIVWGLCITTVLGHLSYLFLERTARRLLEQTRIHRAAIFLAIFAGIVALPGMLIWEKQGVAGRFSHEVELVAAEANNVNLRLPVCQPNIGETSPSCIYGGNEWKVIAAGDSHVGAIVSGIAEAAPHGEAGVVQWSYAACPFVFGMTRTREAVAKLSSQYKCTEFIETARSRLNTLPASIPIVIISRYAQAGLGPNEDHLVFDTPEVFFSKKYSTTTSQFLHEFSQHITSTACELAKKRTVYMVRPIPEMGVDIPKALSRRMNFGILGDISMPMEAYQKRNAWVWAAQNAARDECGIKILDPIPYLCHDGRCYGSKNGRPLYYDDDHLSEFGNKLLVPMFAEVFQTISR